MIGEGAGDSPVYPREALLVLTDDGLLFKQCAEEIVELMERASREFLDRDAISGVIALGATEAVGSRTLAKLMKRFSELYPEVRFDVYNEMADNVKDRIDRGLVDIGFVLEPVDTTKYDFMRLSQKETWGILVPSHHPLPGRTYRHDSLQRPGGRQAVKVSRGDFKASEGG